MGGRLRVGLNSTTIMDTTPIEPQFKSRPRTKPPTTVVMHSTAGSSLVGAVVTLRVKGLGYHYLVNRQGVVHKGVNTDRVTGHAGRSVGPGGESVNDYSIGIAFVHRNDGSAIPQAQIDAAARLLRTLADAIPSLEWVTTHYAITVRPSGSYRKSDPRGCPLELLAEKSGLKPWKPSYATRYSL